MSSSSLGNFKVLKFDKFSSDNNFYDRALRHANQLIRLIIVDFTMELLKIKRGLYNFMQSQIPASVLLIRALFVRRVHVLYVARNLFLLSISNLCIVYMPPVFRN